MKGTLSSLLKNNTGDQKRDASSYEGEPRTMPGNSESQSCDEDRHPDELFISDTDWGGTSDTQTVRPKISDASNDVSVNVSAGVKEVTDSFDNELEENIWVDTSKTDTARPISFEPAEGFFPAWIESIEQEQLFRSLSTELNHDSIGNTYIHYVAAFGSSAMLRRLIEGGWPLRNKNFAGQTPFDFAKEYRRGENADFLRLMIRDRFNEDVINAKLDVIEVVLSHTHLEKNQYPPKEATSFSTDEEPNSPRGMTKEVEDHVVLNREPACVACRASFALFITDVKPTFCPFCGVGQPPNAFRDSNGSQINSNEVATYEKTSEDRQHLERNLLEDVFPRSYSMISDPHLADIPNPTRDMPEMDLAVGARSETSPAVDAKPFEPQTANLIEDHWDGSDKGFELDEFYSEFKRHNSPADGQNSFHQSDNLNDLKETKSKETRKQDWEFFLDNDLEGQSEPTDQYFADEDPLETGKITQYAARLTRQIATYKSVNRKKTYEFFISVLGDFPFFQSYAALERLLAKGHQIDHLQDVYLVKHLWLTNPSVWSNRRYNKMERMWVISGNSKLKNSMSWQLASDLVEKYPAASLENLIVNDWYAEWVNLPIMDTSTPSGMAPEYSLYPSYIHQKRKANLSTIYVW